MKKFMIAAFALLFCVAGAIAQDASVSAKPKKSPEERAERFSKRMTKELSLDASQQERVKTINLDRFKKIEAVRTTSSYTKPETQQKLKEINEAYFNDLKGVLSAEQFAQFQKMKEEIKEKAFQKRQAK
jgi:protein CpxP